MAGVRFPSQTFVLPRTSANDNSAPLAGFRPALATISGTGPARHSRLGLECVDDLLTIREVAARLRICTATVYKLIARGKLPATRFADSFLRVQASDLPLLAFPWVAR